MIMQTFKAGIRKAAVFGFFSLCMTAFAGEVFFDNGKTDWKIYVSAKADPTEQYAAEELQKALKKVSGADFEIVAAEKAPSSKTVIVGDLKNPEIAANAKRLNLREDKVETSAVYTLDGKLYLAGNAPRGVLYAVYSFLQNQLGVRWLWPGPDGEFITARKTWELPAVSYNHTPSFAHRGFHLCGDRKGPGTSAEFMEWEARNFLNYNGHAAPPDKKRMGFYSVLGGHGIRLPEKLFATHPEYFAAEKGGIRHSDQICFSNPDVLKLVAENIAKEIRVKPYIDVVGMIPADNPHCCRCPECSKMTPSTAWFEFYNRLTDILKKEFPHLKFKTLAYSFYKSVPECKIRNCEYVQYSTYARCNIHPYGHPECKDNESEIKNMLEWQAAGVPMGSYNYEHAVFRTTSLTSERGVRFLPFLSMIDDTAKTYKRLGHVALIPEADLIGFLPKYKTLVPTEDYVYQTQHRLTFYLYARIMWDSELKMTDVLRDWCKTLFGVAEQPVYDYYLAIDRAWTGMPIHVKILEGSAGAAPLLLGGDMQKRAEAFFLDAEKRAAQINDASENARVKDAIRRERTFFKQWQNLYYASASFSPRRIDVPLYASENNSELYYSKPRRLNGGTEAGDEVSVAWSQDKLFVKWSCPVNGNKNPETELIISDGVIGEKWHFISGQYGAGKCYREFRNGSMDKEWNPSWKTDAVKNKNRLETSMEIPFASLGQSPNPRECWYAKFICRRNGSQALFPDGDTEALLLFSTSARTDKTALWWLGFENSRDKYLEASFKDIGYELQVVKNSADLAVLSKGCTAYWLQNPTGVKYIAGSAWAESTPVPDEYWKKTLLPAVRDGAVVVFGTVYGKTPLPLEEYFKDVSFGIQYVTSGLPYIMRKSRDIAPGDWSLKPNNIQRNLKTAIAPSYGYVPEAWEAWTVLATLPLSDGDATCPYIIVRPYGKGLVAVCDSDIKIPRAQLLDNLVLYNSRRDKDE